MGTLTDGGGFCYQSIKDMTDSIGDACQFLDFLAKDVDIIGAFADRLATVTDHANCMGV